MRASTELTARNPEAAEDEPEGLSSETEKLPPARRAAGAPLIAAVFASALTRIEVLPTQSQVAPVWLTSSKIMRQNFPHAVKHARVPLLIASGRLISSIPTAAWR
jgi:hypothetical protein